MTTVRANTIESVKVERLNDEHGAIELTVHCEDGTTVVIDCGRFADDAEALCDLLKEAYEDTARMVTDWEDRPEEEDGYVSFDRDGYYVQLGGQWWNPVTQELVNHSNARNIDPLPDQDIATYELAAAMTNSGFFPNAWYVNDRGIFFEIAEDVRKYHDFGGTDLLPLEGVSFEEGQEVIVDGDEGVIAKDYGTLGVVWHIHYDNTPQLVEHKHRSTIKLVEEDDNE